MTRGIMGPLILVVAGGRELDRHHLVEAAGADKVVLGTDYPFDMGVTDPVERATAAGLPAADLAAILSGNAASLLGLSPATG
jgi:predicted TIM-barrel fold metal-dependent hydrolase